MDHEYYFLVIPVSAETIAFVIVIETEQLTKSLPQTIYRHINHDKRSKSGNKRTGIVELMRAYRDFLDFDTSKLLA
jgi:hypothetical protein